MLFNGNGLLAVVVAILVDFTVKITHTGNTYNKIQTTPITPHTPHTCHWYIHRSIHTTLSRSRDTAANVHPLFATWSACGHRGCEGGRAHTAAHTGRHAAFPVPGRWPTTWSKQQSQRAQVEKATTPMTKHARAATVEQTREQTREGRNRQPKLRSMSLLFTTSARVLYHVAASPREVIAAPFLRCFEVRSARGRRSYW